MNNLVAGLRSSFDAVDRAVLHDLFMENGLPLLASLMLRCYRPTLRDKSIAVMRDVNEPQYTIRFDLDGHKITNLRWSWHPRGDLLSELRRLHELLVLC